MIWNLFLEVVDDAELKEELRAFQYFLVNSELEKGEIEYSISACQPTTLWLMKNWSTCSESSNVQPKLTSHSDLF